MSATEKAAGPVTPQELEDVALRVAQAASTLQILNLAHAERATLENALGLVTDYLDECAQDLSELHHRHQKDEEARP
jgi:hypothetical protein